jgi:hypothetical protein
MARFDEQLVQVQHTRASPGASATTPAICPSTPVAIHTLPVAICSGATWRAAGISAMNPASHALMMALARGEMPYGQFVQEDTLIGIRTAAAIRPFTQEAE